MAINTSLLIAAPMLQDYLVDKTGAPLAAGIVTLYQDNNRTTLKNWYYQSGSPGAYTYIALPNPMTLSAAGTIQDAMGNDTIPFFYPFDENDQTVSQPYYITVDNSNLQRQFTRQNFPFNPNGGSSGPTVQTLSNVLINNSFWRNIGTLDATTLASTVTIGTPLSTSTAKYVTVAPSQHDGFTFPDINFVKDVNGGADTITFTKFAQSATPILTGDITPEFFLNHAATTGGGETIKYYQFPISLHLQTLDLAEFTATIQATASINSSPGNTIQLYLYQYCGSGKASPAPFPIGAPIVLNNSWTKYTRTASFPSDATVTLSAGGDDAWFLQVGLAPNATLNVSFTLPSIYLGTIVPTNSFTTYDQINSIISSPRTGDVRIATNSFYYFGWVPMNDGTIGSSTSNATTRANTDTWPLFNLLWNLAKPYDSGSMSNPICQMYSSAGSAVDFGTSAIGDFTTSNRALALTKAMGHVFLGTVPLSALLAATPSISGYSSVVTGSNSAGTLLLTTAASDLFNVFLGDTVTFTGSSLPGNIFAKNIYYAVPQSSTTFFVATSFANAMAGTYVAYSSTGSGTITAFASLTGSVEGEYQHTQLVAELAAHSHGPLAGTDFVVAPGTATVAAGAGATTYTQLSNLTTTTGSSTPFNVTQPGTFYNIYIKL